MKPKMLIKWAGEESHAIARDIAAREIRKNRHANPALGVTVRRAFNDIYIVSKFLGVVCCIYRAN